MNPIKPVPLSWNRAELAYLTGGMMKYDSKIYKLRYCNCKGWQERSAKFHILTYPWAFERKKKYWLDNPETHKDEIEYLLPA